MRTERLFDIDASSDSFFATVLECREENGEFCIILDKTLFFPEEGGQSCDTGSIDGVTVRRVSEKQGIIYHYTDAAITVGNRVEGRIDYQERYRKMQNHTGEHIVSGLIFRYFGLNNVGFHLSSDGLTADFDGELSDENIRMIEDMANRVVYECRAVRGYYPASEDLKGMEYRSKLDLTENVRIVEIDGVDLCACCAPHVSNTGEVGMIKILEYPRYKGGIRISMKCGIDALEGYRAEYEQIKHISMALSAKKSEVADGVDRLLDEIDTMKGKMSQMKREIMSLRLERIEYTEGNLCIFEDDGDMLALRNLVNEAKNRCGGICACFSGNDETGYKYIISSTTVDLRARTKEINAAIIGRGGGSSEMIQGSCTAKRVAIENYFNK